MSKSYLFLAMLVLSSNCAKDHLKPDCTVGVLIGSVDNCWLLINVTNKAIGLPFTFRSKLYQHVIQTHDTIPPALGQSFYFQFQPIPYNDPYFQSLKCGIVLDGPAPVPFVRVSKSSMTDCI